MEKYDNELERLEKLAKSFGDMGNFTQVMRESFSKLGTEFEDINSRLANVNELLRDSLEERNRLANYLNSILESVDSGIIVTDQNGVVNIFNSAAEKYTGISSSKALGKKYSIVLKKNASPEFDDVIAGKIKSANGEKNVTHKGRDDIPMAYSISSLKSNDSDDSTGAVEIIYDLTETKKLQENFKHVSTLAALGEMAATVAHEIRNPVSAISGFAGLLKRDLQDDDPNKETISKIISGVSVLNSIIENLLDFTKDVSPTLMEIDPVRLVKETVSEMQADSHARNHRFEIVNDKTKLNVRIDPDLFRQVIYNLTRNAIQSEPDGGDVKIIVGKSESKSLILKVQDNGPGIPDNIRAKLFTPFFTTKANGIGLGLATVKKLVELHGGRVKVDNGDNGGAIFTVEIPKGNGRI